MAHNSLTRKHQKMNDRKTKAFFSSVRTGGICYNSVSCVPGRRQFLPYLYFHISEPGGLFLKTISRNDEKAYLREFFLLKDKNGQTNKLYFCLMYCISVYVWACLSQSLTHFPIFGANYKRHEARLKNKMLHSVTFCTVTVISDAASLCKTCPAVKSYLKGAK